MPTSLDSLSHRVGVLLASHDITTIEQLASIHPLILMGIRGFGRKALREVEALVRPGTRCKSLAGDWPCYCQCELCKRQPRRLAAN